jgi:hypothetical protein
VSQWASKLRPKGSWGGLWLFVCALLLTTPAAAWGSTTTPYPGPDTPPASVRYLPEPDTPPGAGPTVVRTVVRTVRQPAVTRPASQPPSRPRAAVGSDASVPATSQPGSSRAAQPVRSSPATGAPKRPSPAATHPAVKASKPKPTPAAAEKKASVALAAPAQERLTPRAAPGRDRGLLVLAGVLLGVVAIGGAVLGEGYRHAFRESHP